MYVLQISLTHAAAMKVRATPYSIRVMAQANPIRSLNRTSEVWGGKSRVRNGTAFSMLLCFIPALSQGFRFLKWSMNSFLPPSREAS